MKLNKLSKAIAVLSVVGIFAPLSNAKPAAAIGLAGLNNNNTLIFFDSSNPGATTSRPVTGLTGGESLLGIDRRPANLLIYGLSNQNRLYTINPFTGAATFTSSLSQPFNGGFISGVDFNPVPDRLRVVGGNNQNFRINVDTGVVATDVTPNGDAPLNFGTAGGDPNITAVAYTNSDNDPSTGTTLYGIDYTADALFIQNPPNAGTLGNGVQAGIPVGSLGVDIDSRGGFNILTQNGVNTAFAALTPTGAPGARLYSIDLATGAASDRGAIGDGTLIISGLTDGPEPVPEPITILGSLTGGGVLALLRRRSRRLKSVN